MLQLDGTINWPWLAVMSPFITWSLIVLFDDLYSVSHANSLPSFNLSLSLARSNDEPQTVQVWYPLPVIGRCVGLASDSSAPSMLLRVLCVVGWFS